jgi:hypothetical protein
LPSASDSMSLYISNATNLIPAFNEFPMIKVVHPAYHCLPNGGHGSFLPSANLRLSWDRVFATDFRLDAGFEYSSSCMRTFGGVCNCYNEVLAELLQLVLSSRTNFYSSSSRAR